MRFLRESIDVRRIKTLDWLGATNCAPRSEPLEQAPPKGALPDPALSADWTTPSGDLTAGFG